MKFSTFEAAWWDRLTGSESDDKPTDGDVEYKAPKGVKKTIRHSGREGDTKTLRKRPTKTPSEEPKKRASKVVQPADLVQEIKAIIQKYPESKRLVVGLVYQEYRAKEKAKLSEMLEIIAEVEKQAPSVPPRTLARIKRIVSTMSLEQLKQVLTKL